MGQGTITVLSPATGSFARDIPVAMRLQSLNGKVLGILWNSKPNGDILLRRIQALLTERFRLAGTIWQQKPRADIPVAKEVLRDLTLRSDFIITGQGD